MKDAVVRTPVPDTGAGVDASSDIAPVEPTVTDADALKDVPPGPEHTIEYVVVTFGETDTEPVTPFAVKPVPVQEVA